MDIVEPFRRISKVSLDIAKEALIQANLKQTPRTRESWAHRCSKRIAKDLDMSISFVGVPPKPGSLVVCNHRSYLDAVVLSAIFETHLVGKSELASWPFLGKFINLGPVVFVDRGNRESGEETQGKILTLLAKKHNVVNFSEGTTSDRIYGTLPFKSGLFYAVAGKPVTIVPAAIDYVVVGAKAEWVGDETFVDHFYKLAGHKGLSAYVSFGPEIWCEDQTNAAELRDHVQEKVELCWAMMF